MDFAKNDLLLLNALRICFNSERIDEIRELSESDWAELVENAIQHGVSPFIWHNIKPFVHALGIPRNTANKFARAYLHSAGKGVVIRNQLFGLLQMFERNSIPVIVVKGAYLAENVYKDFSIRPMTDIDILIKPEDAYSVENTLLASGYTALRSTSEPICSNHYIYKQLCKGVRVEVHIDLRSKDDRDIDINDLWRGSEATTIVGIHARVLDLENLIVYQCYHHSKHLLRHFGIRSMCDLALILKNNENTMNWNLLADCSRKWHSVNCVYLSMNLLKKYLHISVPESFLASLGSPETRIYTLETFSAEIFNSKKSNTIDEAARETPRAVMLLNAIKTRSVLTLLYHAVFPSKKIIVNRYNTKMPFRPVCYLYAMNLGRLIVPYCRIVWKMFKRNSDLIKRIKDETTHQKMQELKKEWLNN